MNFTRLLISLFIVFFSSITQAGMVWTGIAVSSDSVQKLTESSDLLDQAFESSLKDQSVYLDKAWHGIHYLLTGSAGPTRSLASKIIFGGKSFGPEQGYGQAQLLTPKEVKEIAMFLSTIPPEEMANRFNPQAMEKANIYPSIIWVRDNKEALNYLLSFYKELVKFYQTAAQRGHAVIFAVN